MVFRVGTACTVTTNLAIKGIATETKALVLLNEYEGRRLPMAKLRQVLQELSSGPEETARVLEMIQHHLTAEGADPAAVASFLTELNSPMAVVDELGKTTRRLRSPFAMGFETTGAVNVTGPQGGGGQQVTPIPSLHASSANIHFPGPNVGATPSPPPPAPPGPPAPPRLTPAQGMASGYGRPIAPPAPPTIPSPVHGTAIPYPPPPPGALPNLPNPAGNLPMTPNIPMPPPGPGFPHPHGVMPAAQAPRPGLGARPSGTVVMNNPASTLRNVAPPGMHTQQPGRVTPLSVDAAAVPKPSAHQAPLPPGGPGQMPAGTVQRNTMHFGKNMAAKGQAKEDNRPVILVADDDKRVRMVHKIRLEEAGYNIVEASDGTEAWRRLQMGDITLAVLDMKMPGLHGLEVLARLIDSGRKIPVVICSAYDQLKDEFIVATYPWLRYLVKPVTPEAMMTAVKDLLAQASKSA